MTEIKQYSERDAMELDEVGGHYFRHVLAMTSEGLHSKSEIAAELGWRDMQIALLREQLSQLSISAGQADQRKAESDVVRVALGFSADADDVAPCDLVDAIAALQEQVRALAAEGSQMLQLLTDISEQCQECQSESEENVALIDLDYISEVNSYVSRDVGGENPFEATDAFLRDIRAMAVEDFADYIALYNSNSNRHALDFAARIRAGEQS